jgi:hypothetical protein
MNFCFNLLIAFIKRGMLWGEGEEEEEEEEEAIRC